MSKSCLKKYVSVTIYTEACEIKGVHNFAKGKNPKVIFIDLTWIYLAYLKAAVLKYSYYTTEIL